MRYEDCFIPYCIKKDCENCKLKNDTEKLQKGIEELRKAMVEPFVDELNKITDEMREKGVNEKAIQEMNGIAVTIYSIECAKQFAKEIKAYDKKRGG